jgi:hypothetical protein
LRRLLKQMDAQRLTFLESELAAERP